MSEHMLSGIAAAEGIAIGPAFLYIAPVLTIPERRPAAAQAEMARFDQAKAQAGEELGAIHARMLGRADQETAAIFEAHQMMLEDPMLYDAVEAKISAGEIIERAVLGATDEISAQLAAMEDEYFAARALDVQDVGRRLLRILLGVPDSSLDALGQPSIIVAQDLTPSDTASLPPEMTLGFCTAVGGLTSHTAILARTLGLPAIVGLGEGALKQIDGGVMMAMDGGTGKLLLNPAKKSIDALKEKHDKASKWFAILKEKASQDAYTADGHRVEVGANIGDLKSAQDAVQFGAEGVGLLRTEFLYLDQPDPPGEEYQVRVYRDILEAMGGRPVIIRTMDIGGDKPPSFIDFPDEMNPFLGWRALRICLDDLPLFKTQLRAILRAGVGHQPLIMYPMVAGVEDLRAANEVYQVCREELIAEGLPFSENVPVGVMVETPAAAAVSDLLALECDFFSIGTNDLTQYTLAVDRTNEKVAKLYQPLHPAVLRLIRQTIEAAHNKGKWCGMCGELAGMKKAIPILLGIGLDEFSMAPRAIPDAKHLISQISTEKARAIADQALNLPTPQDVEAYMKTVLAEFDLG